MKRNGVRLEIRKHLLISLISTSPFLTPEALAPQVSSERLTTVYYFGRIHVAEG